MSARRDDDDDQLTHGARPKRTPEQIAAAEEHVRGILSYLGEDPAREGLQDTPARVVRAYAEHFSGYAQDPATYLAKTWALRAIALLPEWRTAW